MLALLNFDRSNASNSRAFRSETTNPFNEHHSLSCVEGVIEFPSRPAHVITTGGEPGEAWLQPKLLLCQDATCLQMPMAQGQALDVVSPEKPVDHKRDWTEFGKGWKGTIRNCSKHHQTTWQWCSRRQRI